MTLASNLLKAKHVGVRELKEHLSERLQKDKFLIVTAHGEPTNVIISYQDMLEIIDILDELQDSKALEAVRTGRVAIGKGAKGIKVSSLFDQVRKKRK